ncbi:hypothetical protein [Mesorhizobium caraganae]|uniref:hypothetical protein n=1 Tax=Mesorhizobium caraganae TaxID=483206 RepID=UPI00177D2E89|nr:hypothetical protein [Mesorhizobium caraganae]
MIVQFHGITFDAPVGWEDITDDLPAGSPPTIAKASGVSAVQFSIAKYRSGKKPNADFGVLRSFMLEFCQKNGIDAKHIWAKKFTNTMCVGVLSKTEKQVLSAWYLSDGNDFALVTYISFDEAQHLMDEELEEARTIVSSISF